MVDPQSPHSIESQWDPVYIHSRKEAALILGVWFLAFIWTVPYCYFNGFDSQVEASEIAYILGMPTWVFWGIAIPWMCCNLATIWFCFWYFSEDELEPSSSAPSLTGGGEGGRE